MIQDIAPKTYKNEYKHIQPADDNTILIYNNKEVLYRLDEAGEICYPKKKDLDGFTASYEYLFEMDGELFFLADAKDEILLDGYEYHSVWDYRRAQPKYLAFAGITGHALYTWYGSRQYCGVCGTKTVHDEKERMMKCPKCGQMYYPQICPAVIVAVLHNGKILLTKYAQGNFRRYALIAGFNEIGESIEETVHREVMEEVGLKVKNLRYYKSQPWPFTGTLLMGFFCDLDGDDQITLDKDELAVGKFCTPDEVPEDIEKIALTQEMMTLFKEGRHPV